MIYPAESFIVDAIRRSLIGVKLNNIKQGDAGRDFEDKVESLAGIAVNRGDGVDSQLLDWEFKTRHEDATSAQTIGSMLPDDIITTLSWYATPIAKKIKKQLRATLDKNSIIVAIDLIDFDQPQIQEKLSEAYDHARDQLIKNPDLKYTKYKGFYAYFENTSPETTRSLDFRVSENKMESLKEMATSTFQDIFAYGN